VRELSDLREENARLRHAACPAPVKHVMVDEVGAYPTDGEPERDRCEKCRCQVMPQDFAPGEPVICLECATPEAA
jgi:hypothetical protein